MRPKKQPGASRRQVKNFNRAAKHLPPKKKKTVKKSVVKSPRAKSIKDGFNNPFIHKPDKIVNKKTGKTLLIEAILKKDIEKINLLIKSNANVNLASADLKTPLHYAAAQNDINIMNMLIDAGAHIDATDKKGRSPLFETLESKAPDQAIDLLLNAGANADITDKDGLSVLHIAAASKTPATIKKLFDAMKHPDQADEKGLTPLLHAARDNNIKAVQTLLSEHVSIYSADKNSENILHYAAKRNHPGLLKYLLKTEAIKLINAVDLEGKTPIFAIITPDKQDVIKLMIDAGAKINIADKDKITPLTYAALTNDVGFVKKLLSWGADVSKAPEKKCDTPLVVNIRSFDNIEMVKLLLNHQADPNVAEEDGKTPLMYAVSKGRFDIARLLLASGADVLAKDGEDRNILHFCDKGTPMDMINVFIQGGVNVNQPAGYGQLSPAIIALQNDFTALVSLLIKHPDFDIEAKERSGQTLLMRAVHLGKTTLVNDILKAGANPNTTHGSYQSTALHFAVQRGHDKIVEALLKKGAHVNAKERTGETPLYTALSHDNFGHVNISIVKELMKNGADPLIQNNAGYTPYDLAFSRNDKDILRLFDDYARKKGVDYKPRKMPYRYPYWR